jgi:hypothetical protein
MTSIRPSERRNKNSCFSRPLYVFRHTKFFFLLRIMGVTFCRMDLPGATTSVGTRTDYSVGPWDYPSCATPHLMAWSTRTTEEEYSVRKL